MKVFSIINPVAGRGKARKNWNQVENYLSKRCKDLHVAYTGGPGQGTVLAQKAVQEGADVILAVGGDGTIHEIVNGMMPTGTTSLALLPSGTGNDLARSLAIPINPLKAAELIYTGKRFAMDLALLEDKYVVNMAGIGLDLHILLLRFC